jgi:hypothetical protein
MRTGNLGATISYKTQLQDDGSGSGNPLVPRWPARQERLLEMSAFLAACGGLSAEGVVRSAANSEMQIGGQSILTSAGAAPDLSG